jgi:uncharacterized protein
MSQKKKILQGNVSVKVPLHVTPGAGRNEIVGVLPDGTLRLKVKAPPVEGKANLEVLKYFGELLQIRSDQIVLVNGQQSRKKLIEIFGMTSGQFKQIIKQIIENSAN